MISNHGQQRKYYHDIVGVNSRLDSLQAAILNVKLKHLNAYCETRQKVAEMYDDAFSNIEGIQIPARNPKSTHVFHQYTLKVETDRDALKTYLAEHNIPSMIYYPVPQHLQKAYTPYGFGKGSFPVSELLCEQVLSLPVHTHMDRNQIEYICETVINWRKGK